MMSNPFSKKSTVLMLVGALLPLLVFVLPIWNITLEAPQYPDDLGMDIFINHFQDDRENDIKNINLLNHYIGMQEIPETIPEFSLFPKILMSVCLLGVLFSFLGRKPLFLAWGILFIVLGVFAFHDFYSWEYEYGHNLNPKAIMKYTDDQGNPVTYQPPLFGSKKLLNFVAHSYPRSGAYVLALSVLLSFIAYFVPSKSSLPQVKENDI